MKGFHCGALSHYQGSATTGSPAVLRSPPDIPLPLLLYRHLRFHHEGLP